MHNQPCGKIYPSEADTKLTKKLRDYGLMLDGAVLYYIIICDDQSSSFADVGNI